MREYELTKILVFRDQDAVFADGKIDHVRVFQSLCKFGHRQDVVPILPSMLAQPRNHNSRLRGISTAKRRQVWETMPISSCASVSAA